MRLSPLARTVVASLVVTIAGTAAAQSKPIPVPPAPLGTTQTPIPREESDAEKAMGHWGLTVFSPITFNFGAFGGNPNTVSVYTLGLRHWMGGAAGPFRAWGVDVGFGLVLGRGKTTAPVAGVVTTTDLPSATGFGFHGGVPLAVRHGKHVALVLVPEANLIFASSTVPQPNNTKTEWSGWAIKAGARGGLEIYFGFIGIPQLSMEATVSAAFSYSKQTSKTGPVENSSTSWRFTTARENEPWSMFGGSVAAIYYF